MKLRDAFKTHNWLYKQALAENDTALLEKLFARKMDLEFLFTLREKGHYTQLKPETAAFIAQNLTEGVERRWDKYGVSGSVGLLQEICRLCIKAQPKPDIVEAFIGSRIPAQKLAEWTVELIGSETDRLSLLDKIMEQDASRLHDVDRFARILGMHDMRAEFDLLVAAGFDLHKGNQSLLRDMAEPRQKDFVIHVVTKHGADMDVAINAARIAGHDKVCRYLEDIRAEINPEAAPLMSFEDMAQEITTLRSAVKDLQQMVTVLGDKVQELQNPLKAMDKKPLAKPGNS